MRGRWKVAILRVSKWVGLFVLARYVTRNALRILCYHGFALAGENAFRAKLFISPEVFERRLRYLVAGGFPVLSLGEAVTRLGARNLPPRATVITIDDGFCSVYLRALPLLQKFSLPTTTYVTSYYSMKGSPIFRLVVQYMFWKTKEARLDTTMLGMPQEERVVLRDLAQKEKIVWEIIRFGEKECNEAQRDALAAALGKQLGVDYRRIVQERFLSLMTTAEIRELASAGVDVQLHTHRHQLPNSRDLVDKEILENRAFLEPLVGRRLHHFCYPSGLWSKEHWPWLASLGIETATTCDPGLNYADTPRLALKRFLDADNIQQIEFESEMSGFSELLRALRHAFQIRRGPASTVDQYS